MGNILTRHRVKVNASTAPLPEAPVGRREIPRMESLRSRMKQQPSGPLHYYYG